MSIYRWAKLDDQSGPDRSIELKLELPVKELVVGDSTFARPHVSFEVAGNLHYLGDTAITKFPQHGLCLADLLHAAVDINLNHLGFQRAFRTDHCICLLELPPLYPQHSARADEPAPHVGPRAACPCGEKSVSFI